jgi:hypothetical protein
MRRLSTLGMTAFRALDARRRRGALPIVLCVDVEPDLRVFPRHAPCAWSGFEAFLSRLPSLRGRLTEATGSPVAFTWFLRLDPQVAESWGSPMWPAQTYGAELDALRAEGDELGLHTHTWRWDGDAGTWIADYADESWIGHCLETGLNAYRSAFGEHPRAHRGGDHLLTGPMLAALGRAGVEVDLTIEPGWPPDRGYEGAPTVGLLPDYREVPRHPYRSTPERFPLPYPGGDGPLLVPLFSPPALRRRHRLPLPPDSGHFVSRLALETLRDPPPVLPLVLRSDPDALELWDLVATNLEHLARLRGARFLTAGAAARDLGASGA